MKSSVTHTLKPLALLLGLCIAQVQAASLEGIRDGVVHVQGKGTLDLHLEWQNAWQAEAHAERLTLQTGAGVSTDLITIPAEQTRGARSWSLSDGATGYRLEVPGYSFRHYRIRSDSAAGFVFEPAKVHFTLETPHSNLRLYFRIPGGAEAWLGGKHHGGVHTLRARRLSDDLIVEQALTAHDVYPRFDRRALPRASEDQLWELTLVGSGKAAFWLDGTENLFAPAPEALFTPTYPALELTWDARDNVLGPLPKLGAAMPYAPAPESAAPVIEKLGLQAANYYTFVDVLPAGADKEANFRDSYANRYNIRDDITLVAATGRTAVMSDSSATLSALDSWLSKVLPRLGSGNHYLAFADEPNLNYSDYASFERYFASMASKARVRAAELGQRLLIAAPASSRFVNGPTTDNAAERRGLLWAEQLLSRYDHLIDGIAWHEWQVRDLRATHHYRDAVRAALKLVGQHADGRPRKALLLTQTNPSSGNALSVYDQNTQYAALWLAGAALNASAEGMLDMFLWFKAVDDPDFPKGLLTTDLKFKQAGEAMAFLTSAWRGDVLASPTQHLEVDALVIRDGTQYRMLGVNKGRHPLQLKVATEAGRCSSGQTARLLSASGESTLASRCEGTYHRLDVPAETLFILPLAIAKGGMAAPNPPKAVVISHGS